MSASADRVAPARQVPPPPPPTLGEVKAELQEIREALAVENFPDEAGHGLLERIRELSIDARNALGRAGLLLQMQAYVGSAEDYCLQHALWLRRGQPERAWKNLISACDALGTGLDTALRLVAAKMARRADAPRKDIGTSIASLSPGKPDGAVLAFAEHRALLPELASLRTELAEDRRADCAARIARLIAALRRAAILDGTYAKEEQLLARARGELARYSGKWGEQINAVEFLVTLAANLGLIAKDE